MPALSLRFYQRKSERDAKNKGKIDFYSTLIQFALDVCCCVHQEVQESLDSFDATRFYTQRTMLPMQNDDDFRFSLFFTTNAAITTEQTTINGSSRQQRREIWHIKRKNREQMAE